MKKLLTLFSFIMVVVISNTASATVITFDEYAVGTAITNQYADQGVLFSSGIFGESPTISGDLASPTEPVLAPNGIHLYSGDLLISFTGDGATDVSFDSGYWDCLYTAVITVYDTASNIVAVLSNDQFGVYNIDLSSYGTIGAIYFSSILDPAGSAIDNLAFTVPEPATFALLGLGLLAIGFSSRKKKANI